MRDPRWSDNMIMFTSDIIFLGTTSKSLIRYFKIILACVCSNSSGSYERYGFAVSISFFFVLGQLQKFFLFSGWFARCL